uniref:Tetratricopeptide repeat protein 29 n=1 Tax=Acrobeloides nanus TaxID=290746 RepID=A0A914DXY3_9BILA
ECYQSNGDWLQARQYARKQLKIGLEQKDNGLVLNAFKTLANIYEQNGQFGNAVRKCGSLQAQLGNWETAIGVFEERLKLIRNSNLKSLELEADSDMVKVYKKMKDNNQRMAYIESMSKLLEENPQLLTKQEWIYQEDLGEYYMDTEKLEDAREAFERALMLVQEIDHQIKEAELCAALGQVHLRLGEDDEALVYFQQCLTLSQQTRNLPKMSHAYAALGKIHLKLENWDEALECYKYQLTLAKIQNNRQEKLSSLLSMGRVFNKKSEHGTAIKVLVKAKLLGEALNAKQELALCYGYLGECHLAMNNRTKALSNFCKQLSLFSYINDVEGKCETIKHLIEEKKQLGDVEWCKKLCQMRQDVSMDGPLYLRISVLRDSAKSLDELNCIEESIECLETALSLALHNDHNETVTILLDLCACYEQNRRSHKAIQTLKGFSSSQDDLCSPDVYLRLASLLLKTGQVEEARRTVERCSKFHMIDKRFDYALACINFRMGYYNEAMQFVNKFLGENEANPNVMLKKCLVQWYAGGTILAIAQTKAIIRQYGNVTQTHQILDDLNIYLQIDKTTISSLDHLAKTHWEMSRGNWHEAKGHLISMPESNTTLLDSCIIKFFLEEAIELQLIDNTSFDSNINEHESSFGFLNYEKAYIETLITMLLVIHTSNYTVEALRQVEQLKWNRARHKFQQANREFHVPKPTLDTIEHAIVKRSNFLYCLSIDRFTLCWIKRTKTDHLRICYTIQKEKRATMPQFYVELMEKILTLSCIESISQESFEYMVSQMETLIGIHRSDPHFEHLHMLMEKSPRRDSLLCETAILIINEQPDLPSVFSDNNNEILKVSTNGLDMPTLNMIARSRVVFLDGHNMEDEMIDSFALLQHEIKTDLCVLINCDSEELIENLLLSGIKWVIVVERGETFDSKLASLLQSRLGRPSWPLDEIRRLFTRRRIRIYGGKDEIISVDSISLMLRKIITSYDGTTFLKLVQETKAIFLLELTEAEKYAIIEFIHSGKPIAQLSSKKGNVCADTSSDEDEISDLLRIESKERNFMKRIVRIIYFDRIITRTSNVKNKATPHELFDLMKSFESKKKWIRKGREKPSLREYCSEGEDQANHSYISDHELTDTESISGAKVLGIDLYEDSLSFY